MTLGPTPLVRCLTALFAGGLLCAAAAAEPDGPATPMPGASEHQLLACGTRVVYDEGATADPTAVKVRLVWQLDRLKPIADRGVIGRINSEHHEHLADEPYGGIMVQSVVKALRPDGRAAVAMVYTLQHDDVSLASCGFVDAVIDVGRPVHLKGSDDLPVTLTVLLP
jgi:hypothetical protein